MIDVVVQVSIINGKPALNLSGVEIVRENGFAHVSWGDGRALSLWHIGTPVSGPVFIGQMTDAATGALNHLGASARTLAQIWTENLVIKAWLLTRGVREIDGRPVSPHVIAGGN